MNSHKTALKPGDDEINDFMIAEFNLLESAKENLASEQESRGNFFLAVVSGSLIALGVLGQLGIPTDLSATIAFIVLVVLAVLGMSTFYQSLRRNFRLIFYTRGLNRIRHYFVDQDPSIRKYLILETNDQYPPYQVQLGDQSQLISVINSALICACIAGVLLKFTILPLFSAVLIGSAGGIVAYILHQIYSNRMAGEYTKKYLKFQRIESKPDKSKEN